MSRAHGVGFNVADLYELLLQNKISIKSIRKSLYFLYNMLDRTVVVIFIDTRLGAHV